MTTIAEANIDSMTSDAETLLEILHEIGAEKMSPKTLGVRLRSARRIAQEIECKIAAFPDTGVR